MQKMKNNLEIMENEDDVQNKVDGLISTAVIVYVFWEYNVQLSYDDLVIVFKCLKIPPDEKVCEKLMKSIRGFDEKMQRFVHLAIIQLYILYNKQFNNTC